MSKIQQGAVSAVIVNKNNEILFLLRSNDDDFLPGNWDLPGGGMDYGEEPVESLKREVYEESSLEIEIVKILNVSTYFMEEIQRIDISYLCQVIDPAKLRLSSEHSDYKWLKYEEIGKLSLNKYIKSIVMSAEKYLT